METRMTLHESANGGKRRERDVIPHHHRPCMHTRRHIALHLHNLRTPTHKHTARMSKHTHTLSIKNACGLHIFSGVPHMHTVDI